MTLLLELYHKLYHAFGPQDWWPGDTPFEVAVGAILTQNTNWGNVEKAIFNLKTQGVLSAKAIHEMPPDDLALLDKTGRIFQYKGKKAQVFYRPSHE